MGKRVGAAVGEEVGRLIKPGPAREATMVPWRLDSKGRPPGAGVVAEVGATLGTMLGAEGG